MLPSIIFVLVLVSHVDLVCSISETNSDVDIVDDITLESEQYTDIQPPSVEFPISDGVSEVSAVSSVQWPQHDKLLLLSTLDGRLYAVEADTGRVRWLVDRSPVVRTPSNQLARSSMTFLPDPSDGSLYALAGAGRDTLKKLPFTIPELVTAAPCRTADGLLYTGKKEDDWLVVDRATGQVHEFNSDRAHLPDGDDGSFCPADKPGLIFIGRTGGVLVDCPRYAELLQRFERSVLCVGDVLSEDQDAVLSEYAVSVHDSRAGRKRWNVTYSRYSAPDLPREMIDQHSNVLISAASTGLVMSVDPQTGRVLWKAELDSPIVGTFVTRSSSVYRVSHTVVAMETLANQLVHRSLQSSQLVPTLYVGERKAGMYAMPSLADEATVRLISGRSSLPLIEGPTSSGSSHPGGSRAPGSYFKLNNGLLVVDGSSLPLIGQHGEVATDNNVQLTPSQAEENDSIHPALESNDNSAKAHLKSDGHTQRPGNTYLPMSWIERTDHETRATSTMKNKQEHSWYQLLSPTDSHLLNADWLIRSVTSLVIPVSWFSLMVVALLALSIYTLLRRRLSRGQDVSVYSGAESSRGSASSSSYRRQVTAVAEQLSEGVVRVGAITFDTEQCLGKGCEGTFVFKGWFDGRDVAVKRLLPECFMFADREVELLRESDQHPNVIRYFCMEQDHQFRYIALQLCLGTVHDYVQGRYTGPSIGSFDILRQATAGLAHLHALNIVHRDVKPHNVLLSCRAGQPVAMISDFGLCKKLVAGRKSFSRRSGVAGTEGWIAPEMLDGDMRVTSAVDVFSLGCVIFYVLTGGEHPFGGSFRRQLNIISGQHSLGALLKYEASSLVAQMISRVPGDRPQIDDVLAHPLFWSAETTLRFLQDLSDRTEKLTVESELFRRLERRSWETLASYTPAPEGGEVAAGGRLEAISDWRLVIDEALLEDLGRFRSYRGNSVRDLLRAIRNKRNHYRSLLPEARALLGETAEQFVSYWLSRFPRLLIHCWTAGQLVRDESGLAVYYRGQFIWREEPDATLVPPWKRARSNVPTGKISQIASGTACPAEICQNISPDPPGASLTDALRATDNRNSTDPRAVIGCDWSEVSQNVRRRLVEIAREGGACVDDADLLINATSATSDMCSQVSDHVN